MMQFLNWEIQLSAENATSNDFQGNFFPDSSIIFFW